MKKFLIFILLPLFLFGYQVQIKDWEKGQTFYGFLKKNHIPFSLYYSLDKKTRKELSSISHNRDIYLLKDGVYLKQALIPLNDKQQLQIIKKGKKYITKIVPIYYAISEKQVSINVDNFLSYDVYRATKNSISCKKTCRYF